MNTQLAFHNTKFNVVTHNNQVWLSSKELAQALEYASAKSVTDIYNKNLDEFTDGMSLVVESTTNGVNESQRRLKVRIFSLRGAHLIAMFARTPVAKEFRRWVLDVLDREIGTSKIRKTGRYEKIPTDSGLESILTHAQRLNDNLGILMAIWTDNVQPLNPPIVVSGTVMDAYHRSALIAAGIQRAMRR